MTCIGGDRRALIELGLSVVDDEWPGRGRLGGLVTALGWSPDRVVVVAGCDQPWLDADPIRELVAAHDAGGTPATVYRVGDRIQPLPGVYDVGLRPGLMAAMRAGERALAAAVRVSPRRQ